MSRLRKVSLMLQRRIRCWVLSTLWFLLGTVQVMQHKISRRIMSGSILSRMWLSASTMMMRVELLLHKSLRSLELKPRFLKEPKTLKTPANTSKKTK